MEDMEQQTPVEVESEVEGNGRDEAVIEQLRERQRELRPVGKTKILEVPGYQGLLGIEYVYIGSEETELISKRIMKETRAAGGRGMALLSSMDLLIVACKQVMFRSSVEQPWKPLGEDFPIKFDQQLCDKLKFDGRNEREIVLGLFGSEHAIIEQNLQLSNWLGDVTREVDDGFFGLL